MNEQELYRLFWRASLVFPRSLIIGPRASRSSENKTALTKLRALSSLAAATPSLTMTGNLKEFIADSAALD